MKNKIFQYPSFDTDIASLLLRMIFGGLFVYHGYTSLMAFNVILPHFKDLIGIGAKNSFILMIFAQLVCGFLVLIGFLTRLAVIPIFVTMLVAFFIVHINDPFTVKELALLYLLLSIVVFVLGAGKFSVDKIISRNKIPKQ